MIIFKKIRRIQQLVDMKIPIHLFRKEVIEQKEPIDWRLSEENSKKLEIDDVEFAFSQAEKQLVGTIKEADVIITRTSILLTVAFGFIASIIGFVISEVESGRSNYCLIIASIFGVFYLLALTLNLLKNFKGHVYQSVGREPILLLDEYYVIKYPDLKERKVVVLLSEIKNYQKRIDINKKINLKRWNTFKCSLNMMVFSPFLLVSIYIVIKIISKSL
jgi:competence protein ComGF